MEGRRKREERPEGDGNALAALLFGLFIGAVLAAFWAVGETDYSEAMGWGIAALALCRWLGEAER